MMVQMQQQMFMKMARAQKTLSPKDYDEVGNYFTFTSKCPSVLDKETFCFDPMLP
jgi:hypothetical protein